MFSRTTLCAVLTFAFQLVIEGLDWIGRDDQIKTRWPRLWAAMNSRTARMLATVAVVGLLVANLKQMPELSSIHFPQPDPGAKAEILRLRAQVARYRTTRTPEYTSCVQLVRSGRHLAADSFEIHGNIRRGEPTLVVSALSPIPQMQTVAARDSYLKQAVINFMSSDYPVRVARFERGAKENGLDTSLLEARFSALTTVGESMLPSIAQAINGLTDELDTKCTVRP